MGNGMFERYLKRRPKNEFDVTVDEGTFGDYEAFGVYGESGDQTQEYEIFIVSSVTEV